jgi:Las1-like
MMPLPHALESLLSILVAIRQDNASDIGLSSSLSLRQSYATALIRLVNGLVDPLQSGTYARSILSIAAQIGLPAWLVELRHAATHEDLPSLELLRDGAKEVSSLGLSTLYYHRTPKTQKKKIINNSQLTFSPYQVSHLAIAQLFSPHVEPVTSASTSTSASARVLSLSSHRAAAKTVQEPTEDGLTRRVATCTLRRRYLRRTARDWAMAC